MAGGAARRAREREDPDARATWPCCSARRRSSAQGRRALPPLADRVLLADVARKHPGYFAPVAETPGFGEALFRLVRELRGAGYDLSALGPLLDGATDAPEKAGSLAEILSEFEQRRSGFYGPDDALLAADPARLDGLGLLVWGMLDLPPALERLLRRIAERMPVDVLSRRSSCGRGRAVGRAAGTAARQPEPPSARSPSVSEAGHGARACAAIDVHRPGEAARSRRTARCGSCRRRTPRARCGRRRARALQWAREGVPFWDMAVAYRHGEAYLPLAEAVFVEAGIPVYLHEGSPLAERPIGRQTLGLLALFDGELSRQSVMDFLTDAKFPDALHEEYGGIPASRWDSLSREAGIVKGAEQWQRRLGAVQRRGRRRRRCRTGCASVPRTPAGSRRFIADLDQRLRERPGAGHLGRASRLPAGPAGALRRGRRRGRSWRCAGSSGSPRWRRRSTSTGSSTSSSARSGRCAPRT